LTILVSPEREVASVLFPFAGRLHLRRADTFFVLRWDYWSGSIRSSRREKPEKSPNSADGLPGPANSSFPLESELSEKPGKAGTASLAKLQVLAAR
jgi:hypothetical protein